MHVISNDARPFNTLLLQLIDPFWQIAPVSDELTGLKSYLLRPCSRPIP